MRIRSTPMRRPPILQSAMRSGLHSAMRGLCSTPDTPVRIYRLNQIKMLRAMLRVKVIQLGGGVAVLLPSASIISNGGLPSLAEGSMVAAVVGGTLVAGSTISWYAERIVGEINWLPKQKSLMISTLTMWGERRDRTLSLDELEADGLTPPPPVTAEPSDGADAEPGGEYPPSGFAALELCGITYVTVWNRQHVVQPEAMARLIARQQLPFDPHSPLPDVVVQPPSGSGGGATKAPPAEDSEEKIKFF